MRRAAINSMLSLVIVASWIRIAALAMPESHAAELETRRSQVGPTAVEDMPRIVTAAYRSVALGWCDAGEEDPLGSALAGQLEQLGSLAPAARGAARSAVLAEHARLLAAGGCSALTAVASRSE